MGAAAAEPVGGASLQPILYPPLECDGGDEKKEAEEGSGEEKGEEGKRERAERGKKKGESNRGSRR